MAGHTDRRKDKPPLGGEKGFARKYTPLTENVILSAAKDLKTPASEYFAEPDTLLFRFFVAESILSATEGLLRIVHAGCHRHHKV